MQTAVGINQTKKVAGNSSEYTKMQKKNETVVEMAIQKNKKIAM